MSTNQAVNNLCLHLLSALPCEKPFVQARQQINTVEEILHSFLQTGSEKLYTLIVYSRLVKKKKKNLRVDAQVKFFYKNCQKWS